VEDGSASVDAHVIEELVRRNKSGYVGGVKEDIGEPPLCTKDMPRLSTTRKTKQVGGRELGDER
jgi:hypothetical protein